MVLKWLGKVFHLEIFFGEGWLSLMEYLRDITWIQFWTFYIHKLKFRLNLQLKGRRFERKHNLKSLCTFFSFQLKRNLGSLTEISILNTYCHFTDPLGSYRNNIFIWILHSRNFLSFIFWLNSFETSFAYNKFEKLKMRTINYEGKLILDQI